MASRATRRSTIRKRPANRPTIPPRKPPGAAASDNYTITYINGTLTITAKDTQTITASDVTATYGDTDKKVTAATDGNGAISYAVKDGSANYIDVNASTGALTIKKVPSDGKAYVVVTAAETPTYAQATKEVTVTINKANAVPATVTANNRAYDGTEKPLVTVTGETNGGTLKIAVTTVDQEPNAEAYTFDSTSIPKATNAGTYFVWYKVKGDDNHLDTEPASVQVVIEVPKVTPTPEATPTPEVTPTPKATPTPAPTVQKVKMTAVYNSAKGADMLLS